MIMVSNDPSWWPSMNSWHIGSYFVVATSAGLIYDWVLTLAKEVELIWRQRWSLMTVLYMSGRYSGIIYAIVQILYSVPTIPKTVSGCAVMKLGGIWMTVVVNAILGVIIIARLDAMYQRSRKVLIPLVVIFLADYIAVGVVVVLATRHSSGKMLILSGTYECAIDYGSDNTLLFSISWILTTVWEVLALCLAVRIAVKHFRELRRHSSGWIIKDCFTVLMKTHIAYFASFVFVSGFEIGSQLSPTLSDQYYSDLIFLGLLQIFQIVQMFVLGPRLILSIREYHAKLVDDSDTATGMNSIVFQERVHVTTSSSV